MALSIPHGEGVAFSISDEEKMALSISDGERVTQRGVALFIPHRVVFTKYI